MKYRKFILKGFKDKWYIVKKIFDKQIDGTIHSTYQDNNDNYLSNKRTAPMPGTYVTDKQMLMICDEIPFQFSEIFTETISTKDNCAHDWKEYFLFVCKELRCSRCDVLKIGDWHGKRKNWNSSVSAS